jgi:hypothetical protein
LRLRNPDASRQRLARRPRKEHAALQKVLIALDDVKVRAGAAVRGAGTPDNEETA